MAGAPKWKVFDSNGKYQAACKELEAAAALMAVYGEGATIRSGHSKGETVWAEGQEAQVAAESWDFVADVASTRYLYKTASALKKIHGEAWVRNALEQHGYDEKVIAEALAA